jgi:hypothetical protein
MAQLNIGSSGFSMNNTSSRNWDGRRVDRIVLRLRVSNIKLC